MTGFETYVRPVTNSSETPFGAASTTSPTAADTDVPAITTTSAADCDTIDDTVSRNNQPVAACHRASKTR